MPNRRRFHPPNSLGQKSATQISPGPVATTPQKYFGSPDSDEPISSTKSLKLSSFPSSLDSSSSEEKLQIRKSQSVLSHLIPSEEKPLSTTPKPSVVNQPSNIDGALPLLKTPTCVLEKCDTQQVDSERPPYTGSFFDRQEDSDSERQTNTGSFFDTEEEADSERQSNSTGSFFDTEEEADSERHSNTGSFFDMQEKADSERQSNTGSFFDVSSVSAELVDSECICSESDISCKGETSSDESVPCCGRKCRNLKVTLAATVSASNSAAFSRLDKDSVTATKKFAKMSPFPEKERQTDKFGQEDCSCKPKVIRRTSRSDTSRIDRSAGIEIKVEPEDETEKTLESKTDLPPLSSDTEDIDTFVDPIYAHLVNQRCQVVEVNGCKISLGPLPFPVLHPGPY